MIIEEINRRFKYDVDHRGLCGIFNNVSILKKGVIESENSTIDISEINSGNYILRIYADGIQQNLKFSK